MLLYISLQFLLCFDSLGYKDRCANINFLTYLLTYWLGVRKSVRPVKMSDEVLVWLSVCREVQMVCIHHPLTLYSRLKPSFFANPSHGTFPFLLWDRLHRFPGLLSDTLHIRFYFLFFLLHFFSVVPCGRLCWLMSAFERISYLSYRSRHHKSFHHRVARPPDAVSTIFRHEGHWDV